MGPVKSVIRAVVNRLGYDVIRLERSTERTLLGLATLGIETVIDVGANEGQFARMMTARLPEARFYSFEPLRGPFEELEAWASTQHNSVICRQIALGAKPGELTMFEHTAHSPSSSFLNTTEDNLRLYPQTQSQRSVVVPVSTLDDELASELSAGGRNVLLKLDVQGYEDRVLEGGSRVLSKCAAVLIEMNIAPLYDSQADYYDLVNLFRAAGFRYGGNLGQAYDEHGRVVYVDAVFLAH